MRHVSVPASRFSVCGRLLQHLYQSPDTESFLWNIYTQAVVGMTMHISLNFISMCEVLTGFWNGNAFFWWHALLRKLTQLWPSEFPYHKHTVCRLLFTYGSDYYISVVSPR